VLEVARFRSALRAWAAGGPEAATAEALARALATGGLRTVVLVEGVSDQNAVEALAAMRGRDLAGDGVCVVPMGGAMSAGRYLRLLGPDGLAVAVRGLCDEAEVPHVERALARYPGVSTMDCFQVCRADLEDELIRALGPAGVEAVIADQGELDKLRVFQNQPVQRGWTLERQLRRFMGTTSGRKARYGRALVLALTGGQVPVPLDRLLDSPQ
jgi:hypothetical protein